MSKLTKKFKGQISKETEKAVEISIVNKDEMFTAWIPKSALDMKDMKEDYLTVTGFQTFHIKQWFVDSKAKEEETKTEFLGKADEITTVKVNGAQIQIHPPSSNTTTNYQPGEPTPAKSLTVMMPAAPTPDRVEYPYFPAMTIVELRIYHGNEQNGAIRGHIENIIIEKERDDETKAFNATVLRILLQILEGKGK